MGERIAIFSDVHGNTTALEAVYKDSVERKVDKYWFLGDLFSPGPGANDLWELFQQINPEICVRGNWDDLFIHANQGIVSTEKSSLVYISKLAQTVATQLPLEQVIASMKHWNLKQFIKIKGIKIGITHNLPNLNYGQKLYPTEDQKNFNELFSEGENLDLAIYAHVHHPIMRYSDAEQVILNPGSVGQPFFEWDKFQRDMRAEYLIIDIDDYGIDDIQFRKVYYSRNFEYERAKRANLPYLDVYKLQLTTGKVHTHDHELLSRINDERGYLHDVIEYNKKHRN